MKTRLFSLLTILCITEFSLQANSIFSEKTINAAKAKACQENKIIIMEFTAKWCIPAKEMEKAVFGNVKVQKFIAENAVLFQVDIDQQKHLKAEYKIQVLPTIILMRASGKILSRKEESFNAESFIAWVEENLENMPKPASAQTEETQSDENISIEMPLLELDEFDSDKIAQADSDQTLTTAPNGQIVTSSISQIHQPIASNKLFHIQAGVFSSRDNADNLSILLAARFNQHILIATETSTQKIIYKVRIGEFDSEDEAGVFLSYMQKNQFNGVVKAN